MNLEQVCQTLKEYLSKFSWARILMPLSSIILYVCCAVQILSNWISFGGVVYQITYLGLFVMMLLVLAQCKFLDVAIGFAVLALDALISVVLAILPPYSYLNYTSLIPLVFFGFLAFLAYKKSVSFR